MGKELSSDVVIRPGINARNWKWYVYPIIIELILFSLGFILHNRVLFILSAVIFFVFPGILIIAFLIVYPSKRIIIFQDKIIFYDFLAFLFGNGIRIRQEIYFKDIEFIYWASKEADYLMALRRKFKIKNSEKDYRAHNLSDKYSINQSQLSKFNQQSNKLSNDSLFAGVLVILDNIYDKYKVSSQIKKNIKKDIKDDANLNYNYLITMLGQYPLSVDDKQELRDEFRSFDTDITSPFLLTRINMKAYEQADNPRLYRYGIHPAKTSIVFSNNDGSKKVYYNKLSHFMQSDWRRLAETIRKKNKSVKFIMTKTELGPFTYKGRTCNFCGLIWNY